MTLTQHLELHRALQRQARAIGPLRPMQPAPVIVACVLWALAGALWLPHLTTRAAGQPPVKIAGALLTVGAHLCKHNRGLDEIHRLDAHLYNFHCRDGAQFARVSVRLKGSTS